ncbi:MAG: type II toxin-antitoxin system ParD family antitoxin [Deltaproteobacteria bacterium]|nr:type II toxin-antitoxin system ParD family antitoxin [Deltaproteobacteria bacterium]
MNVSLSPQLEKWIQKKLETGMYNSASEVIREAIRLMDERDRLQQMKLQELRKDIETGIQEAEQGKLEEGKKVFEKIRSRKK